MREYLELTKTEEIEILAEELKRLEEKDKEAYELIVKLVKKIRQMG